MKPAPPYFGGDSVLVAVLVPATVLVLALVAVLVLVAVMCSQTYASGARQPHCSYAP